MYKNIYFYVTQSLLQADNKEKFSSIIQQEKYARINKFITGIISKTLARHPMIDEQETILICNLQQQLLEQNNNSIYTVLSQLEEVEENVVIALMHHSKLEDKIKGDLCLIDTCILEIERKIEEIAYLQIKKIMMEIIFKFYLEDKKLSNQEFVDILNNTSLDYKLLLGCNELPVEESYIQYSLIDYKEFGQQFSQLDSKEDSVDKIESARYWLYQEVNNQYKDKIKRYLDEEMLTYLQDIHDKWYSQEINQTSNKDLIIVSKIWKKILKELKEMYQQAKKRKLHNDTYQKRLVLTPLGENE